MKFTSGKISLELASEAGAVILECEGTEGQVGLAIDVPRGWSPELEEFTLWCCRFLGIVMDDQPIFTVVSDPVPRDRKEVEFVIGLKGPIGELPKGTVLAPVPEASS